MEQREDRRAGDGGKMSKMKGGTTQYDFYSCLQTHTHLPHTPNIPTSHYTLFSEGRREGGCQDMTQALLAVECDRFLCSTTISHTGLVIIPLYLSSLDLTHIFCLDLCVCQYIWSCLSHSITNSSGLVML